MPTGPIWGSTQGDFEGLRYMEERIRQWMRQPESMGAEALMQLSPLIEQYPYCTAYRMLYTIALANTHSTRLNEELRRTATMLPNSEKLFQLINNGEFEWINLMLDIERKRSQQADAADSFMLIDQFLQRDETGIESLLASDYSLDDLEDLQDEEQGGIDDPDDDSFALIDSFLEADEQGQLFVPQAEKSLEEMHDYDPSQIREKAFLTESLAKLYVKQHKFEQALAIFSSLNLEKSKKSSYFADQIRYLEKVIAYEAEAKSQR